LTTVDWLMVPDVALIVTCELPTGVLGVELLLLEQPATNPAEIIRTANKPRSRRENLRRSDLRRENAKIVPNGRRKAAVIPAVAAPRSVRG
jgi:hypothetical protein